MKNETSLNHKNPPAAKPILGVGLFVRKDVNGNDIKVGDTVKVIRPYMTFESHDETEVEIEEKIWIGEVRLLLSKGILIRSNGAYIKAPITDHSRNKWTWELVKPYAYGCRYDIGFL
jgi:hypothetical protein